MDVYGTCPAVLMELLCCSQGHQLFSDILAAEDPDQRRRGRFQSLSHIEALPDMPIAHPFAETSLRFGVALLRVVEDEKTLQSRSCDNNLPPEPLTKIGLTKLAR